MEILNLLSLLKNYVAELNYNISLCQAYLKNAPQGILHIKKNKDSSYYYCRSSQKDSTGKYLGKKDKTLILALAQKKLDLQLLESYQNQKEIILRTIKDLEKQKTQQNMLEGLPENLQQQLQPHLASINNAKNATYIKRWKEMKYEKMRIENPLIKTLRGEFVRSKSEAMIADRLYAHNIPYRYECPIMTDGVQYCPDFTILNIHTLKTYYWEHCGMMDDKTYVSNLLYKVDNYAAGGHTIGQDLILTFEAGGKPISIVTVEATIKNCLL